MLPCLPIGELIDLYVKFPEKYKVFVDNDEIFLAEISPENENHCTVYFSVETGTEALLAILNYFGVVSEGV